MPNSPYLKTNIIAAVWSCEIEFRLKAVVVYPPMTIYGALPLEVFWMSIVVNVIPESLVNPVNHGPSPQFYVKTFLLRPSR